MEQKYGWCERCGRVSEWGNKLGPCACPSCGRAMFLCYAWMFKNDIDFVDMCSMEMAIKPYCDDCEKRFMCFTESYEA